MLLMLDSSPKSIEKVDDDELRIIWGDGHESVYPFRLLRLKCPCAMCRDEWSGEMLLDPEAVPQDLKAERAEPVGNYALAFGFSDGHGTGIYSFENLRKLCPCRQCSYHQASETN